MATKTQKTFRPSELAQRLNVSPKVLRAWLRANHPRPDEAKNTSWEIPLPVAKEAQQHFAKSKAEDEAE